MVPPIGSISTGPSYGHNLDQRPLSGHTSWRYHSDSLSIPTGFELDREGGSRMSHWIGTMSPADAGMNEFKECMRRLRDGYPGEALSHVRRALGAAPKNPFYLSYAGLLAA